jgi:hypothetical protein
MPQGGLLQELKKLIHFNIYVTARLVPVSALARGTLGDEKDYNK